METRICKKCNIELPLSNDFFSIVVNKNSNGTSYRMFRGSCKKCCSNSVRSRQKNNPEKLHANENKRQMLKKNAEGSYTPNDIEKIRVYQQGNCYYCGKDLDENTQIDHKIPLSKGGSHYPSNLVLSCRPCNADKHAKTALEFFIWRIENALSVNGLFFNRRTKELI